MSLPPSSAFPHYDRITMASDLPPREWVRDAKNWRHFPNKRLDKQHPVCYTSVLHTTTPHLDFPLTVCTSPVTMPYVKHVPQWLVSCNLTNRTRADLEYLVQAVWGSLDVPLISRIEFAIDFDWPYDEFNRSVAFYHKHSSNYQPTGMYFGSPRSSAQVCIYDKAKERGLENQNWDRLERRVRFYGKERIPMTDFLEGTYIQTGKIKNRPFGTCLVLAYYREVAAALAAQHELQLAELVLSRGLDSINSDPSIDRKLREKVRKTARQCAINLNAMFLEYANQWHQYGVAKVYLLIQRIKPEWLIEDDFSDTDIEELAWDVARPA